MIGFGSGRGYLTVLRTLGCQGHSIAATASLKLAQSPLSAGCVSLNFPLGPADDAARGKPRTGLPGPVALVWMEGPTMSIRKLAVLALLAALTGCQTFASRPVSDVSACSYKPSDTALAGAFSDEHAAVQPAVFAPADGSMAVIQPVGYPAYGPPMAAPEVSWAYGATCPCQAGHAGHFHNGGRYGYFGGAHRTPGYPHHHLRREYVGPPGPPTAQIGYPYYTIRGPRDFLLDNPPSIGR